MDAGRKVSRPRALLVFQDETLLGSVITEHGVVHVEMYPSEIGDDGGPIIMHYLSMHVVMRGEEFEKTIESKTGRYSSRYVVTCANRFATEVMEQGKGA